MVMDADFEVPLPGVKVVIPETGQEVVTGDTGSFYLEQIEPGAYTVMFSKGGYSRMTKPGIVVSPGQLAEVEASLAGEYEEMDELVVKEINLGGASEIGLLNLRMESSALMDSVGAEMMSRAGASDAASALKLVSGTTVQDGKYAVVRGLPDRYVVSLMNGARMPTADINKRAVQLDQFPSVAIESLQVAKTFTPDQQGDATGGAVDILLKGIPDEFTARAKVGVKFKTNVTDDNFLSYEGGGVNYWGFDDGGRDPQPSGTDWDGAVGTESVDAPFLYDWDVSLGGKVEVADGVKVGGIASFYYKSDANVYLDVKDNRYLQNGNIMEPQLFQGSGGLEGHTSLFEGTRSVEEVQWGTLNAIGIETENNAVELLYMRTHVAEDKATYGEDTQGKRYFFGEDYDPYDTDDPGNQSDTVDLAPYQRAYTLEYIERDTETIQLAGEHTIPTPDWELGSRFTFLQPEVDWKVTGASSALYSPDKRLFGEKWLPRQYQEIDLGIPGFPPIINDVPAQYRQIKPDANFTQGNLQRIWKDVEETSQQFALNGELPFEQWSGDEGFVKLGWFQDLVERTYKQDSYSNFSDPNNSLVSDWDTSWATVFPDEVHLISASEIDVNYEAEQDLSAYYAMMDLPVASYLKFIGGARFESTSFDVVLDPEADVLWSDPNGPPGSSQALNPGDGDVSFDQDDVLPSIQMVVSPLERWSFRLGYSETVARQTFKELTPIQQSEYLGGDVFIGNPYLQMGAIKNYDIRVDYNPYPGGLVSFSYFYKDFTDPIEYEQAYAENIGVYTTAENYPAGELNGLEFEVRQDLGHFWDICRGLSLGGNITLLDSYVEYSEEEKQQLETNLGVMADGRDMLKMPEHIYNVYVSYDFDKTGTKLGLFYTVKGDTLEEGRSSTRAIPSVYSKEVAELNFTMSQKLGDHLTLSFKAKNLTNPEIQRVYRDEELDEDWVKNSYTKGMEFSLGLSAAW